MSAIDEIMGQADDFARAWMDAQTAKIGDRINAYAYRIEERAALRELIAAAIADARRDGAIEAQQRIFPCCGGSDESPAKHCMDCETRVLPTGPRKVVRLTDEQALRALPECHGSSLGKSWLLSAVRAIETAVLAANGMGDGNG